MKSAKMLTILVLALVLVVCHAKLSEAAPMDTAITYQGRLMDSNEPADELYDFQFKLYDAESDGNQVGDDVNIPNVDVIEGYFMVELDFGSGVFTGDTRWLEIGVRPGDSNDPNDFVTLSPRQEVTPVPYALQTRGIFVDPNGNVGIGTTSPTEKLDIVGNARIDGDLEVTGSQNIDGLVTATDGFGGGNSFYYGGWIRIFGATPNNDLAFRTGGGTPPNADVGTEIMRLTETGSLGIGTTSPSERLHVVGNIRIVDGNEGANRVLTSDANGVASWQAPSTGALPRGVIVMWFGLINDVPGGWALCDGGTYTAPNGDQVTTPDLRDRFIVGARQDDGGVAKTNVKGSLMKTGGEHEHRLTIAEMPSHTHEESGHGGWPGRAASDPVGAQRQQQTGPAGGDQPHENCPPFYALAFIMRL